MIANAKAKSFPVINIVNVFGDGIQNGYILDTHTICINFGLYNEHGINKHTSCGINDDMDIVSKTGTLSESLFHELCHAFHDVTGILKMTGSPALDCIYNGSSAKYLWTTKENPIDEELYNITGKYYDGVSICFDPICCNMFDICNSLKIGKKIEQRIFHTPYENYNNILSICNFNSLAELSMAVREHKAFDKIIEMYEIYGNNPDFILNMDEFLINVSSYMLMEN
jgi:hypothetical protein